MFIDEVILKVKAGNGGDGAVAFFPMKKGPCGGPGGRGGSVFVRGNNQMADLHRYAGQAVMKAENGDKGMSFRKNGKNGEDLFLDVPVGTLLIDTESGFELEINDNKKDYLIAKGGVGGKGNSSFSTPTHQVPREFEKGTVGEKKTYNVVLKLIADFGLIGLPSAGKSSLLNELTAAKVKTAMYAFTTLEPNLGVLESKVIADIPGLIEGASKGKGLGFKFLKHVEKVPILLHCIAADSKDVEKDYQTINQELGSYNKKLLDKKQIILLTKSDLLSEDEMTALIKRMKKYRSEVLPISIYNPNQFDNLKKYLLEF